MQAQYSGAEILLIRHARAVHGGRLCGRTDVPATLPPEAELAPLRAYLADVPTVLCSPALRCRQTAAALWPDRDALDEDPRLWEQDFGEWEGRKFEDLPDIGAVSNAELAEHRPPGGESFTELCARVDTVFPDLPPAGPVAIVAHAGVVRAALARALGRTDVALSFEVASLSLTRLRRLGGEALGVIATNWRCGP